jgi:NADPH-dependent 2,4-dienoyl-CoA reductase/sulfur reductase-like enzyme
MVCFARALMADPEMPNKAAQGRVEDIRPCFGSSSCLHQVAINKPIECSMNPFLGYEHELSVKPAPKKKRVMVIGAGPAGLEAARMAAERGHEVMIYEKEGEIGGRLRRWALMKGTEIEDYPGILTYYRTQLKKLGVTVVAGKEVNPEVARQVNPDAVIVVTGSQPVFPKIPGRERFHVFSTTEITQKLCDEKVGKRAVVVGGNFEGLVTAVFLAKQGRQVTVIEEGEQAGAGMNVVWMVKSLAWLQGKNVPIITGARCEEISSKGITITTKGGIRQTIEADTVFIVTGSQEDSQLPQALKPVVGEVHTIPFPADDEWGYIGGAIHGGARVGMAV